MTPKQKTFVHRIIEREGLTFVSDNLALEFSGNRTNVLAELNHKETQALINNFIKPSSTQKMKRKILSMAHEIRWVTPEGKIDINKLNNWCKKYTPSHCDFNAISAKDLPIVVSIYEKMYKNVLKQL